MACEEFRTTIDGHEYFYVQRAAKVSLKLKYRLLGIMGSSVAELITKRGAPEDEQAQAFGHALEGVFASNDADALVDLIAYIVEPIFRDGERIDFDAAFTGNFTELYKVIFWVLQCEYGAFFKEAGDLLPA